MSSIGHSAQDYGLCYNASGMGAVQIRYFTYKVWIGGRVGHCKSTSCLRVESGVPRDSESGGRPPLLGLANGHGWR